MESKLTIILNNTLLKSLSIINKQVHKMSEGDLTKKIKIGKKNIFNQLS